VIKKLILAAAFTIAPHFAQAAELGPAVKMVGTYKAEYRDIKSDAVGETFRIFISEPNMMEPGKKYPVIYMLDGNGTFGMATDVARILSMGGEIPNAYVVAVGYSVDNGFMGTMDKRFRDYTPTLGGPLEAATKAQFDPTDSVKPGGGPAFLKFLQDELKPAIEADYAVDPGDATIAGVSLGGLLPAWVLLTAPETFQRYVIISPSIWWNGEEVWQWEEATAAARKDIEATVFVTAGGLEKQSLMKQQVSAMAAIEGPGQAAMQQTVALYEQYGWLRMASITPEFADKLKSRNYPGLTIDCYNFPDETHMSVGAGALSRGLRYVFGHWQP
jgi:predicted alpha/beta superfamily hydrolase